MAPPLLDPQRSNNASINTTTEVATDPMSLPDQPRKKAYQFIEGRPSSTPAAPAVEDKENAQPTDSEGRQVESPSKFPSTPASRLPLLDLIGDPEESEATATNSALREEHIQWNTTRSPRSVATPLPAGRKRARSTSPPSASQSDPKRQKVTGRETPHIDAASDLWDRYNVNSNKGNATLAALLGSSSPHSAKSDGNVSGLRRWTSCGLEWPTSKRKPRAAEPTRTNLMEVFTDFEGTVTPAKPSSRPLKLGGLIERIQESLSLPAPPERDGPSSSSPLPDRKAQYDVQAVSPQRAPELAERDHSPLQPRRPPQSETTSFGSDMAMVADAVERDAQQPQPPQPPQQTDDEDDEFGDDFDFSADEFDKMTGRAQDTGQAAAMSQEEESDVDDELFAAAEASATQAARTTSKPTATPTSKSTSTPNSKPTRIQRYKVREVCQGHFTDMRGSKRPEQVIMVEEEGSTMVKSIILRESWLDTRCTAGSYVHVIGSFDMHGLCIVDDSQNILILHPDHLISALVVADSYSCMRKAVLEDRIKAASESSPPMLYGTIIHEIFQNALQANRWDDEWLEEDIQKLVRRHIEDLYKTQLSEAQAIDHLTSKLPAIKEWASTFVKQRPDLRTLVEDPHGKQVKLSVNKLLDVEEHIWSPMFGLKGNIDATVQVAVEDEDGPRTLTVPFELKTGKRESASHRAQTALYTLMLSDRYDVSVIYGVLFYVETGKTHRIPAIRHELRHLIMQRNELACYVRERLSLPPMLRNTHVCGRCYAKTPCFIYHKLAEQGDGDTSGLRDKFDAVTQHLQPVHQAFFKKWDDLLTKEESDMMKFRRELWTMLSSEREKLGRCFSNVVLIPSSFTMDPGASKINRFAYTFEKQTLDPLFSFSESQISVGEPVVISDENGHYALAKGFVTSITRSRISVAVDRRLHNARAKAPDFDEVTNQKFAGIMSLESSRVIQQDQKTRYRLDKDEFSNGMATTRNNLIQMMTHDTFRSRGLQSLIVDKKPPSFKPLPSSYAIAGSQSQINADQRGAIDKILSAEDYALVLGMPGTGKTTTIAHIIRALVAKGKSVLLASYTHTAVDNILLKIRSPDTPVLRLGALSKIHPEVKEFAQLAEEPSTSAEELHSKWHDPLVVGTTCLGINHPLFQQRIFDYCIVDEASQITLPVCLGPIRMARVFVLVGDHYQLPPLVQNDAAKQGGLDISLFKELSDAHPNAVATLSEQYRMSEPIMRLSSQLIYDGRLKCGSEAVARQRLILPHFDALTRVHRERSTASVSASASQGCPSLASPSCVLAASLAPASPPVSFLNTDALSPSCNEIRQGPRITNPLEVAITVQVVRALLTAGLAPTSIGVITLYRSQLALLRQELNTALGSLTAAQVEAHTADKYQGRDKDVIIVSLVRANEAAEIGELLRDSRRVNVAITRARRKLILLGSRHTMERGDQLLKELVKLCAQGGGMVDVPPAWTHEFASPSMPTTQHTQRSVRASADASQTVSPGKGARKPLGDVSANAHGRSAVPGKVVRGQKRITPALTKRRGVFTDIMHEVIGEELDL